MLLSLHYFDTLALQSAMLSRKQIKIVVKVGPSYALPLCIFIFIKIL